MFEPVPKEKVDRLLYFLKDDQYALLFCLDMLWISHVWDNLIDKDEEMADEDINKAFIKALAGIPTNPFYQRLQAPLMSMMYNTLALWLESNELRKTGGADEGVTANALENAVIEIIHFCILTKGGLDWAREVALEFWQLFGPSYDELQESLGLNNV